ncbi:hypothetical protein AB0N73_09945 [Microbacterium sp. NPDC089189]|uniref:hypothetical protein n=1 Tax=Microbacterium sp. NPDC089189 TaxID=3154972 RepID=UPI003429D7C5
MREAKSAEPEIPEEITPFDLHSSARNELKTLSKENAEAVARHLAMAARLIDEDPERAHAHAMAASRRAGRVAVVRETVGITAYATGDFALALRELRTYRRISGSEEQIALIVDSERGMGRPDRALESGRSVDKTDLPVEVRVHLAIAMSGARLDLGEAERALAELDIAELDPDRAFAWSPALFLARATVLEELGREDEAEEWSHRAAVAAEALDDASGVGTDEEIIVMEEFDDDELDGDELDGDELDDDEDDENEDVVATETDDVVAEPGEESEPQSELEPESEPEPALEDPIEAEVRELLGEDDVPAEGEKDRD